jgi:hypothetical protein
MLLMYSVQQQQMTFRDLQKLVSQQQKENTRKELFQRLQNKPFWIWNRQQHKLEDIRMDGDCCFNHIIGLPQKDRDDKPLYDYQQQQQDARDVSERYIAKSKPYIVMVSTPNAPDGLFERIEKESEDTCLYKQIFLDYTYGIGKIYTAEEIEKAKQSPSFECEYNLKYLGKIGNVFHTKDIEAAIEKGREYNPDDSNQFYFSSRSMGIDPAYGSSAFGIVVTQWEDNHIQILHAEEYHRPDYNEMLSTVYGLMSKYNVDKVYIDGANPSFIRSLKLQIGEDADYDKVIARYRSEKLGDNWSQDMKIVPVNFNTEQKAMLGHCKMILETDGGSIAINPDRFDKLITALRTAVDNDGTLDKEATSYNDIFDAFRLALKFYHFEERRSE